VKDGLKKSRLVANGKLLTIRSQQLLQMSDISTMTKFRAERTLVVDLTTETEWEVACERMLQAGNSDFV
jgi:uncharacterized metal-binding protein YceD (DUF177 family)